MLIKGLIGFVDILMTTATIKTYFRRFIATFLLEGPVTFIRMYYGPVNH